MDNSEKQIKELKAIILGIVVIAVSVIIGTTGILLSEYMDLIKKCI